MAKIVSKLDLNKTPQLVDNNSLIFAKNIRVLKDGIIGPDFPITPDLSVSGVILGYIVGLNSTIYLFVAESSTTFPLLNVNQFYTNLVPSEGVLNSYSLAISNKYINHTYVWKKEQDFVGYVISIIDSAFGGRLIRQGQSSQIASYYPFKTELTINFSYILNDEETFDTKRVVYNRDESNIKYNIYSYNEQTKILSKIDSAWTWSGGKIHGLCTTNNTGDIILTVCEYFDDNVENKLVPIKHINLSHADVLDESLYTQTPNIPFTNLHFIEYYSNPIPNGVYQFFIRYKIYKDFYTSWFPCSAECFSGARKVTNTIQGSIQYVDTSLNSNESFVFEVEHLLNGENQYEEDYTKNFKEFQIGFIVAHDDSIDARSWKHFPINTKRIYFDYDKAFIEEINIDDLLKSVYEISNVKNITYFRNKLYISNYIESDINEDLTSAAFDVNCELIQQEISLSNNAGNIDEVLIIDDKSYPSIDGTSNPTLYNIGFDVESVITKTINDTVYVPQENSNGLIYKAYYKAHPGLDPDQFFLRSGYDCSINNENPSTPEYAVPNVLSTFCLININDDEDFEDIYFYNNQTHTASSAGRLVYADPYDLGDWVYSRVLGTPDTKQTISMGDDETRTIYIHPLNDVVDWFCASCYSKDLVGKEYGFVVNSIDSNYKIFALKKPQGAYDKKYCIETYAPDWDTEETCANWDKAEQKISEQLLNYIRENYPKYVLKSVTLYSNNTPIPIGPESYSTTSRTIHNIEGINEIEIESKPYNDFRGISDKALINISRTNIDFISWCNNYLSSKIIDANGNVYFLNEGTYKIIDRVEIDYSEFSYSIGNVDKHFSETGGLDDGELYKITTDINSSVRKHHTTIYYSSKRSNESISGIADKINTRSLLPLTDYKFYIHYIKSNGVVTNGYQIGNAPYKLTIFDETFEHSIIYPKFDNITIPEGYSGYFISIEKVGNEVASCFNVRLNEDLTERIADCLEIDSMLFPLNENITIFDSNGYKVTDKAKYYPSSTTDPAILLGNVGCIRWNVADEYNVEDESDVESSSQAISEELSSSNITTRLWVSIKNNSENTNTNRLIKLTPYLNGGDFGYNDNDYTKLNMPGFYCSVCKPVDVKLNENEEIYLYVNGSELYKKKANNNALVIEDHDALMVHLDTYNAHPYYVYSNFNLSYFTLYDMSYKQIKYKRYVTIDEDTGQTVEKNKQMLFMLDSSTISYIYILPTMYKDYTRKLYSSKQEDKLYIFDNVVRSSDVNTDETYKYIYNFDALDYYTVPANKGKIINLFNITQSIFIHCEHSLFKFSGANTLSAKDTEVQLTENDIFDTGITELFDAKYGFAGLQVKHQSLITYDAYIFYDNIANTLYAYFGENNLVNLSDSIYKLLSNKDFVDVLFNADIKNNRFFVNFIYSDSSNLCLSYNFGTKSFVSIHDFTFTEGIFTRLGCYFLDFGKVSLFTIADRFSEVNSTTKYNRLYTTSKLFIKDMTIPNIPYNAVENCLDIVCNIEYEKIKLINYVNWICNQINQYADDIEGVNLFVAEENISKYAGSKLRIYTDQCSTELINLENSNGEIYEQNTQSISNPNSYIYPRYNCGVWSLNYFRDVKNIEDIFKYKDAIPPTQQEETYNRGLVNSDRSLIYGKYFVLRLIFRNKNFKLENINFNIQDYEKV